MTRLSRWIGILVRPRQGLDEREREGEERVRKCACVCVCVSVYKGASVNVCLYWIHHVVLYRKSTGARIRAALVCVCAKRGSLCVLTEP